MGRPAKYKTPEEMDVKINEYLEECKAGKPTAWINKRGERQEGILPEPPTVEGLCLHLGYASYQGLEGAGKKPGFAEPLTRARLKIVREWVQGSSQDRYNPKISEMVVKSIAPRYVTKIDVAISGDLRGKLQDAHQRAAEHKASESE